MILFRGQVDSTMLLGMELKILGFESTFSETESTFLGSQRKVLFRRQGVKSDFSRSSLGRRSVELGKV